MSELSEKRDEITRIHYAWLKAAESLHSYVWLSRRFRQILVGLAAFCGCLVWFAVAPQTYDNFNFGFAAVVGAVLLTVVFAAIAFIVTSFIIDRPWLNSGHSKVRGSEMVALQAAHAAYIAAYGDCMPEKLRHGWTFDPDDVRIMTVQVSGVVYECSSLTSVDSAFRHRSGGTANPAETSYFDPRQMVRQVHRNFLAQHPDVPLDDLSKTEQGSQKRATDSTPGR